MNTTLIRTEDVEPGTVIEFLGDTHTVATIEARQHPTVPQVDRIIRCTDGWSTAAESAGFVRTVAL